MDTPARERPPRRIVVVGTTGSGKTTLARRLAEALGVPRIELDALYWEPEWTPAAPEVFRERVRQAAAGPAWVADGNYSAVRDLLWARAQAVVWLDYSFPRTFSRLLRRTVSRAVSREPLWNGNRESLRKSFLSRDSILWWAITTYSERRKRYPELFRRPEFWHLTVLRLRSPAEARTVLERLGRIGGEQEAGRMGTIPAGGGQDV